MATSSFTRTWCQRKRTPGDLLYESLEDLEHYDFKRFKEKLSDFSYEGLSPIPRQSLETADRIATKNLLRDVYGEETALNVTISVFKLINLLEPAKDLQHSMTKYDYRLRYMDDMRHTYHLIKHHDKRIGEDFNLKKRYTSLLLVKRYWHEEERQHEITASGQRHLQIMANGSSDESSTITLESLFDLDDGIIPKIVVLQGPAGIGKTMACQHIMLDWAYGNLYKDKFKFVFYITCSKINTIAGHISLERYLSRFCGFTCASDFLQSIFNHAEGILLIIDGFDELIWSSVKDSDVCEDPFQEVSKETLLNSLIRKKLLRDSSLIITTRTFSLRKLKDLVECTRYVEILGFTVHDSEQYFYNSCKTKEQADLILSEVKNNDILFSMCAIPISCWIVHTVMSPLLKEGSRGIDSITSTFIYLLYLKGLLKYHIRNSAQAINSCVKKLCTLAIEGIWTKRIIFEEEDLARHRLCGSELQSMFLNENIFQRDVGESITYSFIPLKVQDFFAALYFALDEKEAFVNLKMTKLKDLLEASEDHAHLKLTVQFLFGLSSEKQVQETQRTTGFTTTFREKSVLGEWLNRNSSDYHNEIIYYLYETRDKDYVERMMPQFLNVKIKGHLYGKRSDQENIGCRAIAYCLEKSTIKHIVTFEDYILGPKARNLLSSALYNCSKLWLQSCGLTSSCFDHLRSILKENRSLIRLDLSGNNLQNYGIKHLCDRLRRSGCYLQELGLRKCHLTSSCCEELRSALSINHSLVRLDLSENNLLDSGVKRLCEGLRHSACTLQELGLQDCNLTSSCCDDLRSVLITNQTLLRLDLSENYLQDSGIKHLCEGLTHPACTLQDLRLQMCGLTSSCCDDLRSVIIAKRTLLRLDLTRNYLQDSGIKHLCEGLTHPACNLQELTLWRCHVTSSCCDDLRSVLITNRSLVTLDLRGNNLQGCEVELQEFVRPPLQFLVSTRVFQKWRLENISNKSIGLRN
ncbi:NACHT, LRR and PYD domains-containing protein 3-like isoform X2 [Mixophyes fleayi]|uniref:NACHT, LRR and PYD domains-containing protein 3-like isoform X2 n=1 Tax=Mixophyes fleayi TaxID=3061075 RepID=UPI003F4D99E7